MTLTNKEKNQILMSFLQTVEGISNKIYQERVWIRGEGWEVDDFDETVCHFFDEGDPILDNYKSFGITDAQYKLLKRFRKEFKAFCDENDFPQEFIDTPEWEKIMNLATDVLKSFNYKKK